jgi:hypothetical protein
MNCQGVGFQANETSVETELRGGGEIPTQESTGGIVSKKSQGFGSGGLRNTKQTEELAAGEGERQRDADRQTERRRDRSSGALSGSKTGQKKIEEDI